jgi:hypothetical protein
MGKNKKETAVPKSGLSSVVGNFCSNYITVFRRLSVRLKPTLQLHVLVIFSKQPKAAYIVVDSKVPSLKAGQKSM